MRLPKQLTICGYVYKLKKVDGTTHSAGPFKGLSDLTNQVIYLDKWLPEDEMLSTLLHEILEVVNYVHTLNLAHHKIMCIENSLFSTMRDNKLKFYTKQRR
jgi:hypothetical protein